MIMKILQINKSDSTGGAAVACLRLTKALLADNKDVNVLVQEKINNDDFVNSTGESFFKKKINFLKFISERLFFLPYEKNAELRFAFSPADFGENISKNKLVQEADIIHIHWINQGFLSLRNIQQLLSLNKPVVYTLHDMWLFTGGCHYAGTCENYSIKCGNCKFLKNPKPNDLSYKILQKKIKLFSSENLHIIACSNWLANKAKQSTLLKNFPITSIPNPIDTKIFQPISKKTALQKWNLEPTKKYILFGSANIFDKRKGLIYFIEALNFMKLNMPKILENTECLVFGKMKHELNENFPIKVNSLGYLQHTEDIVKAYNAADVFVLPSLEDNLPNTIMEAAACGTPTLAFNTGGIPEMIVHETTGYLSDYKSAESIAKGLQYVFENKTLLAQNARNYKIKNYSSEVVAQIFNSFYENMSSV